LKPFLVYSSDATERKCVHSETAASNPARYHQIIEIRNAETLFGVGDTNEDRSPVKEIVNDEGKAVGEIRNRETFLGVGDTNEDGSPVKEVVNDEGEAVSEIHNKETLLGAGDTNEDGSPVQEIVPTAD